MHQVLPLKRRIFSDADDPEFTSPLMVNTDFSRLTGNKTIAKTRMGSVSLVDLEKLEKCSLSLLEGNSCALWLMSALLSELNHDGFSPSDPTLFDKAVSSISSTLALQTSMAVAMSDFIVSKHQESHLAHVSLPISASQKRDLSISPGSNSSLFDQSLLEKVSGQVKEGSFILSSLSLAKFAGAKLDGKSKSSSSSSSSLAAGYSHYSSPLDYPHPGSSGFRKRFASPACGGGGKRGCGGRGVSPFLAAHKGFRKWVPCPCPLTVGGCLSLHWQAWSDRGAEPWMVEVLRWGYRIPFRSSSVLGAHPLSIL